MHASRVHIVDCHEFCDELLLGFVFCRIEGASERTSGNSAESMERIRASWEHYDHLWALIIIIFLMANLQMVSAKNQMSVNIVNEVGAPIYVHCKSRDNDLQQQTLLDGQDYGFTFRANIWGTTLFWCGFNWGSYWNIFNVWQDIGPWSFDHRPCRQCLWTVRRDGFYRCEMFGTPVFVHPWNTTVPAPNALVENGTF
jgi:hypothetical protein